MTDKTIADELRGVLENATSVLLGATPFTDDGLQAKLSVVANYRIRLLGEALQRLNCDIIPRIEDMERDRLINQHLAAIAGAPRWRRIGHMLLVSWRCPACKAAKLRRLDRTSATK